MTMGDGKPQQGGGTFMDLLGNLGFPPPQQVITELQRLNANLEAIRPDIHILALAAQTGELKDFAAAIKEGSSSADKIYERLWGTSPSSRARRPTGVS